MAGLFETSSGANRRAGRPSFFRRSEGDLRATGAERAVPRLKKNIALTRRRCLNAEARFRRTAQLSTLLLAWYAFLIVGNSVPQIFVPDPAPYLAAQYITYLAAVIFIAAVFLSGHSLAQAAERMRVCALHLDRLYYKALAMAGDESVTHERFRDISEQYAALSQGFDNHTRLDDTRALLDTTIPSFTYDYLVLRFNHTMAVIFSFYSLFALLYALPLVILLSP